MRSAVAFASVAFMPAFVTAVFVDPKNNDLLLLMLLSAVIAPVLITLHELGHWAAAKLVGLEVSLVSVGRGPKLWRGKLLDSAFRFHLLPLEGRTYLGASTLRSLRLKLWLSVIAGPMVHVLLIALGVLFWSKNIGLVGRSFLPLWVVFNAILLAFNLLPIRSTHESRSATDGWQMLTLPFKKARQLEIYLVASARVTTYMHLVDGEYETAAKSAQASLAHRPDDAGLALMMASCEIYLGRCEAARTRLESLLENATLTPTFDAYANNGLALVRWMEQPEDPRALREADALSSRSYSSFPCVLAYRSTRAFILTACGRPDEALGLLEYSNYRKGSKVDRGDQDLARAFALRRLGREQEAAQALERGLTLSRRQPSRLMALINPLPAPVTA